MKTLTAVLLVLSISWSSGELALGGLSSEEHKPLQKDDPVVQIVPTLSNEIRSQVAAKLSTGDSSAQNSIKDAPITVLAYKTQVVAGRNYFVRATIGKNVFLLRIYEPLQGPPTLNAVKGPVKESDPIEYFP